MFLKGSFYSQHRVTAQHIGSLTQHNLPMQSDCALDPDRNPDHPQNVMDCYSAKRFMQQIR